MSQARATDRFLFYAVVVVLITALAFIVWSAMSLRQRQFELSEVAVGRMQQMFRVRLESMFIELQEDLREEAEAILEWDAPEPTQLLQRWRPLMRTQWSITAIRLANENGDQVAIVRDAEGSMLTITNSTGADLTTVVYQINDQETPALDRDGATQASGLDPRTAKWFSKALESSRREPVWGLGDVLEDGRPCLHLSYLIRGRIEEEPYRILMFTIDIGRSAWVDLRSSPLHQLGVVLIDDGGRPLNMPDERKDPVIREAETQAMAWWKERRSSSPFSVFAEDRHFRGSFRAHELHGLTLYAGTLLDVATISAWTDAERNWLMVIAVLVMLLTVLLTWMWLRRRNEEEARRQRDRLSRTQERKLAKAIGEREVLNREVHHRVKNNLQVVSSLLNLQAMRMDNEAVRNEFLRGKQRIDIIALVHHKLYALKDLRNVDLERFFRTLIDELSRRYAPPHNTISYDLATNGLRADQDKAIELGIVLCELVANCYQHAFPYATGGHIDITLQNVEGDLHRLLVRDNGKGLPDGYANGPGKLGLEIVEAMADQLDGSLHVRTNGGTAFEVLFRLPVPPASVALATEPDSIDEPAAGL